jgi:hypothetical protein
VQTDKQFIDLMSALMLDVLEGNITPQQGNTTCNAGQKILTVVKMRHQYGVAKDTKSDKSLLLR